jgi:hypothetical protein
MNHIPKILIYVFNCLIVGSKNSGKSYAMTSLSNMFEENPIYDFRGNHLEQIIILFIPTALNESNIVIIVMQNFKSLSTDEIASERATAGKSHPAGLLPRTGVSCPCDPLQEWPGVRRSARHSLNRGAQGPPPKKAAPPLDRPARRKARQ